MTGNGSIVGADGRADSRQSLLDAGCGVNSGLIPRQYGIQALDEFIYQ